MSTATIAVDRRTQRRMQAAEGYLALEMHEHALRELRAVIDPGDERYKYHLLKAEAYRGLHDWSAAQEEFRYCQGEQPEDLGVLMGLAWCLKRTGELSQAISTMHDAYRAHPKTPVVLYNLSCYYALAGQKSQALSWLGRALRMEPGLRRLIPEETDFDPIRSAPEFQKLLELCA